MPRCWRKSLGFFASLDLDQVIFAMTKYRSHLTKSGRGPFARCTNSARRKKNYLLVTI